ncbi:glycosyltransferase family 76 protein [Botryobasidium botryosum FD-172 SS1]|uniref:GPI mannosyltransferase 2 n=1 Tax=Botryobasidium botryosum (strain FD-172 SS1) TaxID=930990 RepID=A0A067MV60_BOTB1|nr:glycosyltransferase family 76 protein [Botryobasidium botryosum FD-172 SS1]
MAHTATVHSSILVFSKAAAQFLTVALLHVVSRLPLFDTSPAVDFAPPSAVPSAYRWDALHFAHVAQNGYHYEHEFAFFPGTPAVMKLAAGLARSTGAFRGEDLGFVLRAGSIAAWLCNQYSITDLYALTYHHTNSLELSFLTALLSLLPSSPATAHAGAYAEPFFTFLSYRGMLLCTRKKWLLASAFFAVAGAFRANGILLAGFIIWGLVVEPFIRNRQLALSSIAKAATLTAIVTTPFALYQYYAYTRFCKPPHSTPREWCSRTAPLIYSFVQERYWNVGFLRYWTISQLPNFLLAAPVLLLLLYTTAVHLKSSYRMLINGRQAEGLADQGGIFGLPGLLPHAIHAFIFTCILLFASHTQIILRLASSLPYTYWSAANLFLSHPTWAKAWVAWSLVWGAVSLVLWAAFLPPA